jgi:uncharacterized protein (UPF0332 family)
VRQEVGRLLIKAEDCLESSELNLREGFPDAAVNRSYYAIFDALTALLLLKGISVKSHSGAIQQFALHYIKPEIFKTEMQEFLIFCFQKRQKGDYDLYSDLTESEAQECLLKAKHFFSIANRFIAENLPDLESEP